MLNKVNNRKQESKGFTIIEVLIVLAIAGLILLIVFLAVPALQRNSRNTSRKTDANAALAAINEFVSNNGGSLPSTCSGAGTVTWGSGTTSESKEGYYKTGCTSTAGTTAGTVYILPGPTSGNIGAPSTTASADYLKVYTSASCDATTAGQVDVGSTRQVVAVYQIETGSAKFAGACVSA